MNLSFRCLNTTIITLLEILEYILDSLAVFSLPKTLKAKQYGVGSYFLYYAARAIIPNTCCKNLNPSKLPIAPRIKSLILQCLSAPEPQEASLPWFSIFQPLKQSSKPLLFSGLQQCHPLLSSLPSVFPSPIVCMAIITCTKRLSLTFQTTLTPGYKSLKKLNRDHLFVLRLYRQP